MPILKIQEFNKLICSKEIASVYLLAGEEAYLIDSCLKSLEKLLAIDNLNKEVFYAPDHSAQDILNALLTLPFLSQKRVVIVKNVNRMKAVDAEKLIEYLSNPVETSCLILLYSDNYKKETILKRKELLKKCIDKHICVDCRKQYENEVKEFIINEFVSRKKVISSDLVSKILDENGTDLLNISNEIEKLILFTGKDRERISKEDLENISGYTKEINVYALSSHIEEKDLKKALFVLENLLDQGEEPVIILSVISSTLRKLLSAKSMLEEKQMSINDVALALRIHSFYSKAFFSSLKKHNLDKLKANMKAVLQADTAIKVGSTDAASALDNLLIKILFKSTHQ